MACSGGGNWGSGDACVSSSAVRFPSLCLSFCRWCCSCWDYFTQAVMVLLTSTCPVHGYCTVLPQCQPLDRLTEWGHASWSLPRCGYLHAQGYFCSHQMCWVQGDGWPSCAERAEARWAL